MVKLLELMIKVTPEILVKCRVVIKEIWLMSGNRSSSSYFSQVISIPKDGDADNVMTEFKEGILKISIPKLDKPKPQTRKITIQ
jgi:HSP20 family protein